MSEIKKHEFETLEGPHQFTSFSKRKIMWYFLMALFPVFIFSILNFGLKAWNIYIVSVLVCVLFDALFNFIRKKPLHLKDGSAVVTGVLLAMTLSPDVPLWIPVIGAFVAIAIGKHAFGGTGCTIFNPALVGRAFVGVSFGGIVNNYSWPTFLTGSVDAITSATPLGQLQHEGVSSVFNVFGSNIATYSRLFIGNIAGSIGETSALLLLVGGIFLIIYKIIDWRIPVFYIGTVYLLALLTGQNPLLHILGGGLFLGAFFMATAYAGGPITKKGKIIAGLLLGVLTFSIRLLGSMPEGVCFSILMINAATPLIDRFTILKPFGLIQIKEFKLFKKKLKLKKIN